MIGQKPSSPPKSSSPPPPRQAAERAEEAKEEQRREERQNLSEISHTLASDLMTEEEEAAPAGPVGGAKPQVPADRWKGMSAEERSAIHREREKQCMEKRVYICFVFVVVDIMRHRAASENSLK